MSSSTERNRKLRQRRRDAGLCPCCGIEKSETGEYCKGCKKQENDRSKVYHEKKRRGRPRTRTCIDCGSKELRTGRKRCDECFEKNRERRREAYRERGRASCRARNATLRDDALDAYGAVCACCGESIRRFLTIDHIESDGSLHRKEMSGAGIYLWLKKNGYPKYRFQVLCFNCNSGRALNGGVCPHKDIGNGMDRAIKVCKK